MGFGGQGGVGSGMSGMRLVGPTGRDQSFVSTGGKGGTVGAGVGEFGPKVPVSLDKELGLGGTSVGGEGRGEGLPLPVGEVLSATDKALKAMEILRGVLGEEVVASFENFVQENLPPEVPTPPLSPPFLPPLP